MDVLIAVLLVHVGHEPAVVLRQTRLGLLYEPRRGPEAAGADGSSGGRVDPRLRW